MTTEETIQEIQEISSIVKENHKLSSYSCYLVEGDALTFSLKNIKDIREIVIAHPANGEIPAFVSLKATNGKEATLGQLVGRRNNGIEVEGDTLVERFKNFVRALVDGDVTYKVAAVRVFPSVHKGWRNHRIIFWEKV